MKFDLTKPSDSRRYIKWASENLLSKDGSPATYIETNANRKFEFDLLTDNEAIEVANMIWRDIHKQVVRDLS